MLDSQINSQPDSEIESIRRIRVGIKSGRKSLDTVESLADAGEYIPAIEELDRLILMLTLAMSGNSKVTITEVKKKPLILKIFETFILAAWIIFLPQYLYVMYRSFTDGISVPNGGWITSVIGAVMLFILIFIGYPSNLPSDFATKHIDREGGK